MKFSFQKLTNKPTNNNHLKALEHCKQSKSFGRKFGCYTNLDGSNWSYANILVAKACVSKALGAKPAAAAARKENH